MIASYLASVGPYLNPIGSQFCLGGAPSSILPQLTNVAVTVAYVAAQITSIRADFTGVRADFPAISA